MTEPFEKPIGQAAIAGTKEAPRPAARRSRLRRLAVNLAVMLGGCLVALIGVEIVLRLLFYFPQPQFLQADDKVGHRHRPGIHGFYVEEGFSKYSINSHGIRDRDYALAKPAGVFRIAVLGDSYTEALQVVLEETFHEQLERRLTRAEVLSFGVSGYGTAQALLTYRHYARAFKLDLVVLAVCPGNDISDNSKALSGGYPRPYFHLRDGRLVLDSSFLRSRRHQFLKRWGWLYYFVTDHLATTQYLDRWRRTAMTRARVQKRADAQPEKAAEAGLSAGVFGPPDTPELREAWEVTERLILELKAEVELDGARLAIVTVTSAAQVDPALRAATLKEHPDWDLEYADRRIGEFAEKHGIPALVLAGPLLEYSRETGKFLHGFEQKSRGHWNAEGHRAAAERLRDFLAERGLVPREHFERAKK